MNVAVGGLRRAQRANKADRPSVCVVNPPFLSLLTAFNLPIPIPHTPWSRFCGEIRQTISSDL